MSDGIVSYKALEDDEGIDHIELTVVPRYKTSGMSGDEWRVSTEVKFFRKGVLLWGRSFSRLEWAIAFLGAEVDLHRNWLGYSLLGHIMNLYHES